MSSNKLFLIDGHALVFKMFYAFQRRPMVNTKGQDMSILFGFTKYLLELLEKQKPTHVAVAFDPPGGTFRNQMYPEYKANRPPIPQLVIDALEPLTKIVQSLNIPVLMMKGYEADDVIGTVAKTMASDDLDVFMITPDKDYGQLVEEHIFQIKPGKSGGDDELFGPAEVCEKYGISDPKQVIEVLTLCGDSADNVPGVKGVGEVGAKKLLSKYYDLKGIYEHLEELSEKQRTAFEQAKDYIDLSHELVTIKIDVPVETTLKELEYDPEQYDPSVIDLFKEYEFTSLRKYIAHVKPAEAKASTEVKKEPAAEIVISESTVKAVSAAAQKSAICSVVLSSTVRSIFQDPGKITVATSDGSRYIYAAAIASEFKAMLENADIAKVGCDLKFIHNVLSHAGIALNGRLVDIELMHYLVNPEMSHKVELLAPTYLGLGLDIPEEASPAVEMADLFAGSFEEQKAEDRSREACILLPLSEKIRKELDTVGAAVLYDTMEEPLIRVLGSMELEGVKVDLGPLRTFASELQKQILSLETRIREIAEDPKLNVSSPKQIGVVLFEKLQLDPKAKKTASGTYSTDEKTLVELADKHEIIDMILEYRGKKKLLSTYIEPFGGYISPVTGKVHTTFNQALTATGRLSSSNPNLQNIPIRSEEGKEIRKAFVPSNPGGVIVAADYSQIELRIMAHLSCDQHLVSAFKEGIDVHAATAAKIFGVPVEEVTKDQRRIAKTANFGIMYGISSFGLAQNLRLSRSEAKKIIDDYYASFPAILSYRNDTIESAKENGYVETIFGRRRYLPDLSAKNANIRALAERNAVNAPIQGTSADIIKLAMIGVDRRIRETGLKSRMVLQIHDELVFDAIPEEVEALRSIVVSEMENVIELSVPLTVECNYGTNWLEAH